MRLGRRRCRYRRIAFLDLKWFEFFPKRVRKLMTREVCHSWVDGRRPMRADIGSSL